MVKSKLEDRGKKCILLGYAQNSTGGTYHMLNLRTKYIVLSRNIIRLKKPIESMYQENKLPRQVPISYIMKTGPINGLTKNLILSRTKSIPKMQKQKKTLRPNKTIIRNKT